VGGSDGLIQFWDVATGRDRGVLNAHASNVRSIFFSPDGRLMATGSRDNTAKVWDAP
jgi:WD40 repeat protein